MKTIKDVIDNILLQKENPREFRRNRERFMLELAEILAVEAGRNVDDIIKKFDPYYFLPNFETVLKDSVTKNMIELFPDIKLVLGYDYDIECYILFTDLQEGDKIHFYGLQELDNIERDIDAYDRQLTYFQLKEFYKHHRDCKVLLTHNIEPIDN